MIVRAVRNNNPGNIRVGSQKWQGLMPRAQMTPDQAVETAFCVFESPDWGFRAMALIFLNYARLDGIKTIRQAISRWAPPGENNTDAYIEAVCDYTAAKPDAPFDFRNRANLLALCKAVSIHECGGWFFTQSDLAKGVGEALAG